MITKVIIKDGRKFKLFYNSKGECVGSISYPLKGK
jgi:hypothetical protein